MIQKANQTNIKQFQKHMCLMLDQIIEIFERHNLQWFADSGTMLGAIREGKMIDWDNDIDIAMPIKDYVKFLEIAPKELPSNLKVNNVDNNPDVHRLHTTIVDINTTFINLQDDYDSNERRVKMMITDKMDTCMLIDIYGIEHVPEKHTKFFKDYIAWTNFNQNYLCHRWKHPEMMHVIDAEYSKTLHSFYIKTLLKIDEAFKDSEYVICHNCLPITIYEDLQLKAKWYDSYELFDFENLKHKLRVPVGYKNIMFLTYGDDYMTPKQDSHVGCDAFAFIFDIDSRTDFENVESFRTFVRQFKKD